MTPLGRPDGRAGDIPRPVDLWTLVEGAEWTLRRLLPEHTRLRLGRPAQPAWAYADPALLEQALSDLAVNALEAMPQGGLLTVEVAVRQLDGPRAFRHGRVCGGPWATLAVQDTGAGMGEAVLERLFEPSFTTRDPAQGRGQGLPSVQRTAHDAGGQVQVESIEGLGSVLTVWLPLMDAGAARRELARLRPGGGEVAHRLGAGLVWLVEDDPDLRAVAARSLRRHGFDVDAFPGAEEALAACHAGAMPPDLLISDYRLPGLDGAELLGRLRHRWPGLDVLFMSGYPVAELCLPGGELVSVLRKPFTGEALGARVLEVLVPRPLALVE